MCPAWLSWQYPNGSINLNEYVQYKYVRKSPSLLSKHIQPIDVKTFNKDMY